MVVVFRAAANVGGTPVPGEGVKRARLAEKLERSIRGGQAEVRGGASCSLEQLESREPTVRRLDGVQDRSALRRQTSSGRKRQA
jgi:hypothetical protein